MKKNDIPYSDGQMNLLQEYTRHIQSIESLYHSNKNITPEMADSDTEKLQIEYLKKILNEDNHGKKCSSRRSPGCFFTLKKKLASWFR